MRYEVINPTNTLFCHQITATFIYFNHPPI